MKNCLAIEGIGSSSNNSLPVFNQLKLHVVKAESLGSAEIQVAFRFATNDTITVSVTGSGYFATTFAGLDDPSKRLTTKTINASDNEVRLFFKNDDYNILVDGKYSLTLLGNAASSGTNPGIIVCDLSELEYLTNLTNLRFAYCGTTGDTKYIKNLTVLTEVVFQGVTSIRGSILDFANKTSLANMGLLSTRVGSVDGQRETLESFVAGQISSGRTTCEGMKATGLTQQVKFGGTLFAISSVQWLTWSSASKIILYIGSTIANATTIYAMGATAEEIAAWKTAGKTVWAYEGGEWIEK